MVIAGAKVGVAADDIPFLADDQHRLGVGLESGNAVDDIDAGLAHEAGPLDVGGFVEAGLQLDDDGDLLAVLGGVDERGDQGGVGAGPVEGLLDRQGVRILGGLTEEIEDGLETVVRVVEQDVPLADVPEDVGLLGEGDDIGRGESLVAEIGPVDGEGQRHEPREIDRAVVTVEIALGEVEDFQEPVGNAVGAVLLDFQTHGGTAVHMAQLLLDALPLREVEDVGDELHHAAGGDLRR